MKNLKLGLLSLLAILTVSVFLTSCEQENLVSVNELNPESHLNELVKLAHQDNLTEDQEKYLTETYKGLTTDELVQFHELAVDEIYNQLDAEVAQRYQREIDMEKAALKSFRKAVCNDALTVFGKPVNQLNMENISRLIDNTSASNEHLMSMTNIDFFAPEQQDDSIESRGCPTKSFPDPKAYRGDNCSITCLDYNEIMPQGQSDCDYEFGFNTCSSVIDGTSWFTDKMLDGSEPMRRRLQLLYYPSRCYNYNTWILIGKWHMYFWVGPAWYTDDRLRMRSGYPEI